MTIDTAKNAAYHYAAQWTTETLAREFSDHYATLIVDQPENAWQSPSYAFDQWDAARADVTREKYKTTKRAKQ
jgi:hypothetical protein